MVNPALPGVADMLQIFGSTHGPLSIILIQNPGIDVPGMMPAYAMLKKPRGWQSISHRELTGAFRSAYSIAQTHFQGRNVTD